MRLGIEHFFAPVSGYAYLGHVALLLAARKNGAIVRQRPVDIARVFAAGGSTPPVRQSDARRAWRRRDMRLWAAQRALPLNEQPKHWPTDGELAARAIIALDMAGGPVDAFVGAVLGAVWARDLDIADRDVLAGRTGSPRICASGARTRGVRMKNRRPPYACDRAFWRLCCNVHQRPRAPRAGTTE
ncbi:MAG: hypothetical protein U1E19_00160 [Rhodoblastus sp.]